MTTLEQWAMDTFLTEEECNDALLIYDGIGRKNVIRRRKQYIQDVITESEEEQIKVDNLLPSQVDEFHVTDFQTLTLEKNI